MIGSLGWQELLIVLVILALLFGGARVAGLGKSLGQGIREFRQEARVAEEEAASDGARAAAPSDAAAPTSERGDSPSDPEQPG